MLARQPFLTSILMLSFTVPGVAVAQTQVDSIGAAPLAWADCQPGQIEVLILGTFHFAQAQDIDILDPVRQHELQRIVNALAAWAPQRVAVEYPYASQVQLDSAYARFRRGPQGSTSRNEIEQIGFRLARRLAHDRVHAVDVPMNLWDDSIQVFDDRWPTSRERLRARWPLRFANPIHERSRMPLSEILKILNRDAVPANSEMYGGFLPLVEEDVYVGALKLRPWYDRNLRIVQNLFRVSDPDSGRVLLVIGHGHLRVLKQIMEMTPQLCPVSALTVLDSAS